MDKSQYVLKLILMIIIILTFSNIVLAMSPSDYDCDGTMRISGSDKSILCLGTDDIENNPVCLREKDGDTGLHGYVNQMYANFWGKMYADNQWDLLDNIEDSDAIDIAGIMVDYLFGDKNIDCSDYSDGKCSYGDGFKNDPNDPADNKNTGGTASGSCLKYGKFSVSNLIQPGKYGLEGADEVRNFFEAFGGPTEIYPFFYCGGEDAFFAESDGTIKSGGGYVWDLFSGSQNPNGKIVTQEVYDETTDSNKMKVWICDGDHWEELEDYIPDNDEDNDGVPDGQYWDDWDCDSNNPYMYSDLSVFVKNDNELTPLFPVNEEICDDGQANVCENSDLYDMGIYEENEIADGSGNLIEVPEDSCDNNPYACENNCLVSGGNCDYLGYVGDSADPNVATTLGTGYCCGNDQLEDLAVPVTQESTGISHNCLNSDFVTPQPTDCSDGWCWANGDTDEYRIYTVNYLDESGKESFDTVSDGDNWQVCRESEYELEADIDSVTSRFICHAEGDHYSFSECSGEDTENTKNFDGQDSIKIRTIAEGAFALPLVESSSGGSYSTELDDLPEFQADYQDTYTVDGTLPQTVDFTGFDYLEFYVKYDSESIILPENIKLKITGLPDTYVTNEAGTQELADETIYFEQNVLGYAVNEPLIQTGYTIHVRVPVGEWPDIQKIQISPYSELNSIEVLAMYLTRQEDIDGELVQICSGEDSEEESSWITDIDHSDLSYVNGQQICTLRYGENAWLGHDYNEVIDNDAEAANCCGDDANEFYSGSSENDFACFNGRPLANGNTAMQVEMEVGYSTTEYNLSYLNEGFFWYLEGQLGSEISDYSSFLSDYLCDLGDDSTYHSLNCEISGDTLTCILDGITVTMEAAEPGYNHNSNIQNICWWSGRNMYSLGGSVYTITSATDSLGGEYTISYENSPKIFHKIDVDLSSDYEVTYTLSDSSSDYTNFDTYFFLPHTQEKINQETVTFSLDEEDSDYKVPSQFELYLVAETSIIETETNETTESDTFSYTCLQEECTYALPGNYPYQITNPNPHLYDMYFVNEERQETLITSRNQYFNEIGNIKVKSISQQILFDYDQDDQEGGFYGCAAADIINTELLQQNYDYCTVQGNFYCAHQDNGRLVNSWSQDSITQIGYEPVTEFDEDTEFTLQTVSYDATLRNHSTASVPQRNIVPNADFDATDGSDVLYWNYLSSTDVLIDNQQAQVEDGSFQISTSYTLKSEKIAIKSYETYSYSDNSEDCNADLYLIDKDGTEEYVTIKESFESLNYSYLIIEVDGSCTYQEPMLQRTDDLGPNVFEYNPDYPQRQGAACCPEGMCYNGYVCVNNMAEYTYMTEEPHENQTYRCIDGTWSYLEPQYDWNGEEYGFCESESQCFVTSSLSEGAAYGATTDDFYQGSYPYCINDGEYLLDHYCESGEWSSRTKFLATKLLEFAETDDFILYCAPFDQALPDYNVEGYNYQNYLSGEVSTTLETTESLAAELTGESSAGETIEVCYDALENSETGRRLVAQEDNTCVNAVCVLQYKSGDTFQAAFATSLNQNITGDESFLIPLGVPQGELETYCTSETETGDYIECDEQLWYSDNINSIIYAKDGISFEPSLIDNIVSWFLGIFGADVIEDSEDFIQEAQNFNTLYLLSKEDKVVRAVQEVTSEQETLVAEFEGFDSPVCDYINNVDEEFTVVEQWPAEPEYLVDCELTEAGVYRVMTATNTDYWWPQLTSKLRISSQ